METTSRYIKKTKPDIIMVSTPNNNSYINELLTKNRLYGDENFSFEREYDLKFKGKKSD